MTTFWIISAAMLLLALPFIVLPLWRSTGKSNDVLRDAANLEILRDQSAELDNDFQNGLLTQEAYEEGKHELQSRLMEEVKTSGQPDQLKHNPARKLAIALALALPLFSLVLYSVVGTPDAMKILHGSGGAGTMSMDDMMRALELKVEKEPDNPNHLVMLARSYAGLKRYPEAVSAYDKLVKLVPNEPQVWAEYAEAIGMQGRTLQGKPTELLNKALELDGNNMLALDLSANGAMERGDFAKAVVQWQKLLGLLPPDNQYIQTLRDSITQARSMLAMQPGGKEKLAKLADMPDTGKVAVNPAAAVSGNVSLSPELAGKVSPEDSVFILARAAQGPKMPLAVMRKQVKDLPMDFNLNDGMAMSPQMKLSSFDQVVVVARVSKSGQPMPQPGDLEGSVATKTGSKDLKVVIDTVVQ